MKTEPPPPLPSPPPKKKKKIQKIVKNIGGPRIDIFASKINKQENICP